MSLGIESCLAGVFGQIGHLIYNLEGQFRDCLALIEAQN